MTSAGQKLVAGRMPGERIATTVETSNSSGFGLTETAVTSVSAGLVAGRTYRVKFAGNFSTTISGDDITARIREDDVSGDPVQATRRTLDSSSAIGYGVYLEVEVTPGATAVYTYVVTAVRSAGSGTITMSAAATRPNYLTIDYITG